MGAVWMSARDAYRVVTVVPGDWHEIAVHTGTGGTIAPGEVLPGEWSMLSDDPAQPDFRVTLHVRVSGPKLVRSPDFYGTDPGRHGGVAQLRPYQHGRSPGDHQLR